MSGQEARSAASPSRQSKIVGSVRLANGSSYECYEALAPIECDSCGGTIHPGSKFTRLTMIGGGRSRYPMCSECEPHKEVV